MGTLVAAQERAGDTPNDATMATLIANKETFQHMIRVANTNIDGKQKAGFALTSIKGIGRRFCNIALKKAEIDPTKRAGELTQEEIDQFMVVVSNPRTFKIPDYILTGGRTSRTAGTARSSRPPWITSSVRTWSA